MVSLRPVRTLAVILVSDFSSCYCSGHNKVHLRARSCWSCTCSIKHLGGYLGSRNQLRDWSQGLGSVLMMQVTAGQEIESEVVLCKMTIKPRLRSATCCGLVEVNSVSSLALDFVTLLFKNGQMWITVCTHLWLENNSLYLPPSVSLCSRCSVLSLLSSSSTPSVTVDQRTCVFSYWGRAPCCGYNCGSLDVRQLCHTPPSHITFHDVNVFCWSPAFRTPFTSAGSPAMGPLLAR